MWRFRYNKRFSTYLLTTFVVLATLSVLVILVALYGYFEKRVETEFRKKIIAEKGQVEIILNNRIASISSMLKELVSDNIIRVTVMLDDESQLEDRINEFYPSKEGVYFFVKKGGENTVIPKTYTEISENVTRFAQTTYPFGEIFDDDGQTMLIWWFSTPIMHQTQLMGAAYALYDLTQDQKLIETIQLTVSGDVFLIKSDQLLSLTSDKTLQLDKEMRKNIVVNRELLLLGKKIILSKIDGSDNLYFQASLEALINEKRNVTLWIGLFAVVVLAISTIMSILLGRKMVKPLREMTQKAILISEGQKDLQFENKDSNYLEFNQLSKAFNYMLTNLKNAEEHSRYKELLENVDDAVYILDPKGDVLEANEAAYSQIGYTPEQFFQLNLANIISSNHARVILNQLGRGERNKEPKIITIETSHRKTDGTTIPVEIHSRAITYRGRNVILNVARDITERIEAEKALRESEERYRSVVENSHDGIMIMDERFQIIYINNVLSQILGYPASVIIGSTFKQYLDDKSARLAAEHFLKPEVKEKYFSQQIYRIIRKDGDERAVKISANRFQDSKGKERTVAQILDVTEQLRTEQEKKQLETQLKHSQKMEAIGTLAGGIAHDFNNLLMGMQGYISLMRLQTKTDDPHDDYIQGIEKAVMSAANLTNQLLGFARKGKYTLKSTRLNDIVENSSRMFTRTRKEVVIHKKLQPDLWNVKVDQSQIEQVLINLYLNAWHAMQEGGDIFIQSENVNLSDESCKVFEVAGGNYVKVSITDNGIGIDDEIIDRIFEPFFTTKDVGKGTGLGLASAYGIIKNHNGIIRVYSEKGHGTTFNIYLPASNADQAEDAEVTSTLLKGNEKVLLVDDEEGTIQVEELMLKQLGYSVLSAKSGKEAIELYKKNMMDLDLVALDMIMPEMSGRDTFEQLKKINPDVKILLVSGYRFNQQIDELMDMGCRGFIQKPFDIVQLSQKIRDVLET